MNNNDIFKKLRVALQLRDDQIVEILQLVDFRISKGELGNVFRNADHPNYMECGDQLLRNFLNGLVIKLRGTKENPKNANEELAKIANSKIKLGTETNEFPKKKLEDKKPKKNFSKSKEPQKIQVVEKVKFNNGKTKK